MVFFTVAIHEPSGQIDTEIADGESRRFSAASVSVPLGCSNSGEQFSDAERFGHVIVGPAVQGLDLLRLLVSRREDNDGGRVPLPQSLQHILAVEIGKAEVKNHKVGWLRRCHPQSFPTRNGFGNPIAFIR
jgi:hypothetical protein